MDIERFRRADNKIWKKMTINERGRATLPQKLRKYLKINGDRKTQILIEDVKPAKPDEDNKEYYIHVHVGKEKDKEK